MAYYCDPWQMLELARVNKNWYEAFTSDEAWRDWDAYFVETNICSHYLRFRESEQDGQNVRFDDLRSEPNNLYYRLYAYRNGWDIDRLERAPISYLFAKLLAKRPLSFHPSFEAFLPSVAEDEELVIELLKMGVLPDGLPDSYKTNRRAALASISYRALYGYYYDTIEELFCPVEYQAEEPTFFYEAFKDDVEFALDAIERDSACYYILADGVKDNMQVCDRWMELQHLQQPTTKTTERFSTDSNSKFSPRAPTLALSDKSRAIKLVSLYPTLLNNYSDLCRDGKIEADEDVVFAAIDKDTSVPRVIGCFPPALMRKKEFLLKLFKRWRFPWESIPLYLRLDRDVLAGIVKGLQQSWHDKTHVFPDREGRPGLECISALFLCEIPLDINKDMDTLLEILSLPDGFLEDLEEAKDKIYIHRDSLARHLLAKVGVEYGPSSKRPRLQ